MKKLNVALAGLGLAALVTGCASSPICFKASSAPVPPQGYSIIGSEVTGTSDQIWVFGFGGSMELQQTRAYRDAMAKAQRADALVAMSIEQHRFCFFPFFMRESISVTGTPVKFNAK